MTRRRQHPTIGDRRHRWAGWVAWRMVRNFEHHAQTSLTLQQREILHGYMRRALLTPRPISQIDYSKESA